MQLKTNLLLGMLLAATNIFAQNKPANTSTGSAQSIYAELGGNGIFFSVNYDFRFAQSQKGLGMRVGLGYAPGTNDGVITIPLGINHLAGTAPHFFESGLGITYIKTVKGSDILSGLSGSCLVPGIGYRLQPGQRGFLFRITISPLVPLQAGGKTFFWGGIGLGYKF
jgi:hypothetical protein